MPRGRTRRHSPPSRRLVPDPDPAPEPFCGWMQARGLSLALAQTLWTALARAPYGTALDVCYFWKRFDARARASPEPAPDEVRGWQRHVTLVPPHAWAVLLERLVDDGSLTRQQANACLDAILSATDAQGWWL